MQRKEGFQFSHTPIDMGKYFRNSYELNRVKIIEELIPNGQRREVVDIGAGAGYFCKILHAKDWVTTAVDTDPQNIENVKKFANYAILGDAINILSSLKQNCYDLVLALEIVEHMPKSLGKELIQEIKKVLRPKGKLILSTPNRFSLEGLGEYYWAEKIRKQERWKAWDRTHIYIYSSSEIIRLLEESGFLVDKVIGYWYEGRLPLCGHWRLPIQRTQLFPLNRFGFDIILECQKKYVRRRIK